MKLTQRRIRVPLPFRRSLVSLAVFGMVLLPSTVFAAISPSGSVSPTYPGGAPDPWNVGAELRVGDLTTGSLTIDGDSDVTSAGGMLGTDPGIVGTVTVTGTGSTWSNSQALTLGQFGTGKLNVLLGAHVDSKSGGLGQISGGGEVLVDGDGSQWFNTEDIYVGNSASGTLTIQQQGQVKNRSAWIGLNSGDNRVGNRRRSKLALGDWRHVILG